MIDLLNFTAENSFGARMMAKMGWTEGKGLGSKEDGITSFIKTKFKNNTDGIGFTEKNDGWTQHDSEFSKLLENLNGEDITEADLLAKRESLEEKSKTSRARVHYKKFTRGKDLSKYSEKDLANIFGKKSFKPVVVDDVEDEKMVGPEEKFVNKNTIETGLTINDYFKEKYEAKLKGKTNEIDEGFADGASNRGNDTSSDDTNDIKKKMKQKKIETIEKSEITSEEIKSNPSSVEAMEHYVETKRKKKKNQDKHVDVDGVPGDMNNEVIPSTLENNECNLKKKCKKSKRSRKETETDVQYEAEIKTKLEIIDSNDLEEPKKKKKKKNKNRTVQETAIVGEMHSNIEDTEKEKKTFVENSVEIQMPAEDISDVDDKQRKLALADAEIEAEIAESRANSKFPLPEMTIEQIESQKRWLRNMDVEDGVEQKAFKEYDVTQRLKYIVNSDKFQISSIQIDRLKLVKLSEFVNSNVGSLVGYGLDENVVLDIKTSQDYVPAVEEKEVRTTSKYDEDLYSRLDATMNNERIKQNKLLRKKSNYKTKNIFTII